MRRHTILMACASLLIAGGCSKDDTPDLPALKSQSFSGSTLSVNYCGEAMPAKIIDFAPSADNKQATLTLYGGMDLSSLGMEGLTGTIPAPGILPGSEKTTLTVTLAPGKDGDYTFSGTSETPFVSYSYAGEVYADKMVFNVTDATLKQAALAGTVLKPAPLNISLADLADAKDFSSPIHIVWEIEEIPGLEIDPGLLLNAATLAPIVPVYDNTAYMSIAQLLEQTLETVAFNANGNIPVRYWSAKEGAMQLMTTNGTMLQYVLTGQTSLNLYVNPLSAVGMWLVAQSKPTWLPSFLDYSYADTIKQEIEDSKVQLPEADKALLEALGRALITSGADMLSNGLPLEMSMNGDNVSAYIDTETSLKFMSTFLQTAIKEPAILQAVGQALTDAGVSEEDAMKLMTSLPQILQKTTRFEIGLNFIK